MKGNVYTIAAVKDEMSQVFLTPIFVKQIGEAQRSFEWQINNTPIWKDNPSDFSLYRLGFFDEETGEIIVDIEKLVNGRSVRRNES